MIPHSFYQIRPPRMAKESLPGYLYRFYTANGHKIPQPVLRLLSYLYRGEAQERRRAQNSLQVVIGGNVLNEETWWGDSDFPFRSLLVAASALKVCPKCLDEHGIYLSVWDLPLVGACPVHRCRLLGSCSRCQRPLRWSSLGPGWSCWCGLTIPLMRARSASRFEIDLASTLFDARYKRDSNLPVDSRSASNWRREPLETIYAELHQGLAFRSVIVQALRDRRPEKRQSHIRTLPHYWEFRLFRSWPQSFHEAMLRLLCRYWRTTHATLILVNQDPVLNRVLIHLGTSTVVPWAIDTLREASLVLIREYQVQIKIRGVVIFNPRYSLDERDNRLLVFWRWWHRLRRIYLGKKGFLQLSSPLPHVAIEHPREVLIISILTALIDAANAGKSPRRYLPAFARWMYPGYPIHPTTIIRALSEALINLPHAYLTEMHMALNHIALKARKCRRPKS